MSTPKIPWRTRDGYRPKLGDMIFQWDGTQWEVYESGLRKPNNEMIKRINGEDYHSRVFWYQLTDEHSDLHFFKTEAASIRFRIKRKRKEMAEIRRSIDFLKADLRIAMSKCHEKK